MARSGNIVFVIAAAAMVILQIVIAPYIAVGPVVPNFLLAFCIVYAILRPDLPAVVVSFVLGLIYNLIAVGPVGGMAFSLVLIAFFITRFFAVVDNDTLIMPFIAIAVSVLLAEMLYALFVTMFSLDVGFVQAFVYRALPCALYDAILGFVLYLVMRRLSSGGDARTLRGMQG